MDVGGPCTRNQLTIDVKLSRQLGNDSSLKEKPKRQIESHQGGEAGKQCELAQA